MNEPTPHVPDDQLDDPRLELITDYLIGGLDADQVAAVKRRLDEDADFREYCAPLILAWSVPPKHVREPMSRQELAKHWDDFTKRAGFIHQKHKARRRLWRGAWVAILALGVTGYAVRDRILDAWVQARDYQRVPADTAWSKLLGGGEVRVANGTRLLAAKRLTEDQVMNVMLWGAARFRTGTADTVSVIPKIRPIAVLTHGGWIFAANAELTVSTRGDTTDVELPRPAHHSFIGFVPIPTMVFINGPPNDPNSLALKEGERARMVRGHMPVILP
jgi:hypothetical protein